MNAVDTSASGLALLLQSLGVDAAAAPAVVLGAAVGVGAALLLGLVLLLVVLIVRGGRALRESVASLAASQHQLAGGLGAATDAAARAQAETVRLMEARLEGMGERLTERLSERLGGAVSETMSSAMAASAQSTERSLGALGERLSAIDRAQAKIEALSSDVLGLQELLSNKQARGAFGELQLAELIENALPPSAYTLQAPLGDGRVDALLHLPQPPGPLAIDAKFPLEGFEALRRAETPAEKAAAERTFRAAIRAHIRAIADKYVRPGETADGALMFLPAEAIAAELHARHPELVREGFQRRVWIVSPTTLMATLTGLRAVLRDAKLREEAGDLRRELGLLAQEVDRMAGRVRKLGAHFSQAERDVREIGRSAEQTVKRLRRISGDETGSELDRERTAASEGASDAPPTLADDSAPNPPRGAAA